LNLLLDTHLLLWAAGDPERLSVKASDLIEDTGNASHAGGPSEGGRDHPPHLRLAGRGLWRSDYVGLSEGRLKLYS
jgi:hypothetical protein